MARKKTLELRFPSAGVSRRMGFQETVRGTREAYPTPWAVNVRPEDPLAGRLRGGSRPGLVEYTGGEQPAFPTTNLLTESGENILTEAGEEIEVTGSVVPANRAEVIEAIRAYRAHGVSYLSANLGATEGEVPSGFTVAEVYRGRLVLAGGGSGIYFSRQGDWTDWDYGADLEDVGRAFLMQLSEAEEHGDEVTALIADRDSVMIIATAHELWLLEGDPASGGRLQNLSRCVGILSSTAWAKVGESLFFLARDGLYKMSLTGQDITHVSLEHLPTELRDIDLSSVDVHLGYNHSEAGVYVFLVGADYHWFYDLQFDGFWPFTLPAVNDPAAVFKVDGKMTVWDGQTTYWQIGGTDDDGTAIESHVLFGPLRPGGTKEFGLITAIEGVMDAGPGTEVVWRLVEGNSAEDAVERAKTAIEEHMAGNTATAEQYVAAGGSWVDGRSRRNHPRMRGMWAVLWLQSSDAWAYESVVVDMLQIGRWR